MSDIALVSDKVPAHVEAGGGLGNENVTADHLQTPRVKQLQQLSNEVDENHSEYIEGSKPGDFINTITRENYGREIYVMNVKFTEEFVAWKKREKGGGLAGIYPTEKDAIGQQAFIPIAMAFFITLFMIEKLVSIVIRMIQT